MQPFRLDSKVNVQIARQSVINTVPVGQDLCGAHLNDDYPK